MIHATAEYTADCHPFVRYFNDETEAEALHFPATMWDAHGMVRAHADGEPVPSGLRWRAATQNGKAVQL